MFMKKRRHAELMALLKNGPPTPPTSDSGGDSDQEESNTMTRRGSVMEFSDSDNIFPFIAKKENLLAKVNILFYIYTIKTIIGAFLITVDNPPPSPSFHSDILIFLCIILGPLAK